MLCGDKPVRFKPFTLSDLNYGNLQSYLLYLRPSSRGLREKSDTLWPSGASALPGTQPPTREGAGQARVRRPRAE